MPYTIRVEKQIRDYLDFLGMEHRRDVKRALRELRNSRGDIIAPGDQLDGYYRLRFGPFRILFRYHPGKLIECIYISRRALAYEVFEREIVDKLREGR